jgi:ABC-type uncharacterized transport system substrate-binding protein
MLRVLALAAVLAASLLAAPAARAHPHVWVTVKTELVYNPAGDITGVRHHWTFDEMFSAFAVQGLDANGDKKYSREELKELSETNVTSLAEFDFFTFPRGVKGAAFNPPVDYWLDHDGTALTLHFTLPFKTPVKARTMTVEVFDPTYFVSFELAQKDAVHLVGAPAGCTISAEGPKPMDPSKAARLGEDFFNSQAQSSDWGAQFANRISVKCP